MMMLSHPSLCHWRMIAEPAAEPAPPCACSFGRETATKQPFMRMYCVHIERKKEIYPLPFVTWLKVLAISSGMYHQEYVTKCMCILPIWCMHRLNHAWYAWYSTSAIFVVFENIKLLQEYYKTIRLWKINLHNKNYSIHSKKKEKSPIYRKMEDLQNHTHIRKKSFN